jgi:hypothetical protein
MSSLIPVAIPNSRDKPQGMFVTSRGGLWSFVALMKRARREVSFAERLKGPTVGPVLFEQGYEAPRLLKNGAAGEAIFGMVLPLAV